MTRPAPVAPTTGRPPGSKTTASCEASMIRKTPQSRVTVSAVHAMENLQCPLSRQHDNRVRVSRSRRLTSRLTVHGSIANHNPFHMPSSVPDHIHMILQTIQVEVAIKRRASDVNAIRSGQ